MRMILAAICLSMVTGCATERVKRKIWPKDIEPGGLVGITSVQWAAHDGDDNIVICARGKAYAADKYESADFAISVPVESFTARTTEEKRSCHGEILAPDLIPKKVLPPDRAMASCPAAESLQASVPVVAIAPEISNNNCSAASLQVLHDIIVSDTHPVAVYVGPSHGWEVRTLLKRESELGPDAQVIELRVEPPRIEGNKAWLLAMPVAAVFDIVTFPFFVIYLHVAMAVTGDSM